jgi:hypothetical protein
MTAISETFSPARSKSYMAIVWGGLIAGTLDITAACVTSAIKSGVGPMRVLRYVASGLLGPDARNGGTGTALIGLLCHFVIAYGATTVYYLASRKMRFLINYAPVCGPLYGIIVYLVMNLVVLPLSRVPPVTYTVQSVVIGLIVHMLCIGLAIALSVRHWEKA